MLDVHPSSSRPCVEVGVNQVSGWRAAFADTRLEIQIFELVVSSSKFEPIIHLISSLG